MHGMIWEKVVSIWWMIQLLRALSMGSIRCIVKPSVRFLPIIKQKMSNRCKLSLWWIECVVYGHSVLLHERAKKLILPLLRYTFINMTFIAPVSLFVYYAQIQHFNSTLNIAYSLNTHTKMRMLAQIFLWHCLSFARYWQRSPFYLFRK